MLSELGICEPSPRRQSRPHDSRSAHWALAAVTYQMLEWEAAFVMAKDVFVAALAAHPYTVANLLVSLEGTKARIAVLADEGRRRWWLYVRSTVTLES